MQPWDSFGWMLRLEAERRGYGKAETRLFLGDGAKSIRNVWDIHFHGSVFIIDWAHGTEHVGACAKALFGEGTDEARGWYREHRDMLWEGKLDALIAELHTMSEYACGSGRMFPGTSPCRRYHPPK